MTKETSWSCPLCRRLAGLHCMSISRVAGTYLPQRCRPFRIIRLTVPEPTRDGLLAERRVTRLTQEPTIWGMT